MTAKYKCYIGILQEVYDALTCQYCRAEVRAIDRREKRRIKEDFNNENHK